MASSSSSHHQNRESNAFSGIEPDGERRKVSESSRVFDVFINHRGPDVKHTLAIELYNSLRQLGIEAFIDSQEKKLGDWVPSTIETAIRSAKVHIAIFSKRYAESPWCLAELDLMLQSEAKIIPVFYEVKPLELRHIEKGVYAEAFSTYEQKGRYLEKLKEWKEALNSVSFMAGEEFGEIFDSLSDFKTIVAAVKKEVQRKTCLHVATYPVGLNSVVKDFERRCLDELIQDIENQCSLLERKNKPIVVAIFGMGGVGKTTLAKELFNRKRSNYSEACFLSDVREASAGGKLPDLQSQLVEDLLHKEKSFRSIQDGISYLNDYLPRSPLDFLVVVDDIDHVDQLGALLIMDILNKLGKSLVIVTTRDVGVVISAGITVRYPLKGLDRNHGRQLFCWHAFEQPLPCVGFEALVDQFVDVCGGLPLSLLVLGRLVRGRPHSYWEAKLNKAREAPPHDVKKSLRISLDALEVDVKLVFIDIACFFLGKTKCIAARICEGSGWDVQDALQTLKDKCLLEEQELNSHLNSKGEIVLRMHDHLRDLGREMADELSPPRRLWRPQDLRSLELMGLQTILSKTNIRCFHSIFDASMDSRVTFFVGHSDSWVEMTAPLLWLQLQGSFTEQQSILSWIPLQNLQFLKIIGEQIKTLWENRRQIFPRQHESSTSGSDYPNKLRELILSKCFKLEELPSLSRLNCMENIEIDFCHKLKNITLPTTLISLSVHSCRELQRVSGSGDLIKLTKMRIGNCPKLEELPCLSRLSCMKKIQIDCCEKLQYITLPAKVISPSVHKCRYLERVVASELTELIIRKCPNLEELRLSWIQKIKIDYCEKLQHIMLAPTVISLSLHVCTDLQKVVASNGLIDLMELIIGECPNLEELPSLCTLSCIQNIKIDYCEKLHNITLPPTVISLSLHVCRNLQRVVAPNELIELTELIINDCPNLKELPSLCRLNCIEKIKIDYCEKLQNITLPTTVISLSVRNCRELQRAVASNELIELTELVISECPNLEDLPSLCRLSCVQNIKIDYCEKLQNIMLAPTVISLSLHVCRDLRRVVASNELIKLSELIISECPNLEELPSLCRLSCIEKIKIDYCEKLQNITVPPTVMSLSLHVCRDLQKVVASNEFIKISELIISECPNLEELPSLYRLSCIRKFKIDYCEKLQNITLHCSDRELHS